MKIPELIAQFEKEAIIAIDAKALPGILDAAEIIRAEDTYLAGWIRILQIEGQFAIQEESPGGEIFIRKLASLDAAERFVQSRLSDYERMWDGCGCKIDYRGPEGRA